MAGVVREQSNRTDFRRLTNGVESGASAHYRRRFAAVKANCALTVPYCGELENRSDGPDIVHSESLPYGIEKGRTTGGMTLRKSAMRWRRSRIGASPFVVESCI